MMTKETSAKRFGWPHIVGLVVLLALAIGIALLKQQTTEPPTHRQDSARHSSTATIVTPDTTTYEAEFLPPTLEDTPNEDPYGPEYDYTTEGAIDDISPDGRPADQAGYEDGLLAGSEDARTRQYKASYDETNSFIGQAHATYNANYKKGYEDGYKKATAKP